MPNKQLTAKVRLNTTSAEKSIDRLVTKINNIDRVKLCNDLKIKYTTLRDWLTGTTYPRISKIQLLADYFNIPKSLLIENQDELLNDIQKTATLYKTIMNLADNKIEEELLIKSTMLDDENKKKVLELVNMYLKEQDDYIEENQNNK